MKVRLKNNIVAVVWYKLKTTDSVIPLLLELRARNENANIWILFPDVATLATVRKNASLWAAIIHIKAKIVAVRHRSKIVTLINIIKLFIRCSLSRTVFIRFGNLPKHRLFTGCLRKFTNFLEIKCFLPPHPKRQLIAKYRLTQYKRKIRGQPLIYDYFSYECGYYDFFASTVSPTSFREVYHIEPPDGKLLPIGYVRRLPEWIKYMEYLVSSSAFRDKKPYILYLLSDLGTFSKDIREPTRAECFKESLIVLKKFQSQIRTVFKPHANTKESEIDSICRKIGFCNWQISYEHPMVLASNAVFVVSFYYSNAMLDAFFLGKPIVEYQWRDPKIFELWGNSSHAKEYCDFFSYRDPIKFESDIQKILSGDFALNRSEELMSEGFPETPPTFFHLIKSFLNSSESTVAFCEWFSNSLKAQGSSGLNAHG